MLGLSQAGYKDKILARFSMQNSKKGLLPFKNGVPLSDDQRPKTLEEEKTMRQVPYASTMGTLIYAMLCTRPDISYSVGMVSRYQLNPRPKHWQAIKHILKYLSSSKVDSTNNLGKVEIVRISALKSYCMPCMTLCTTLCSM